MVIINARVPLLLLTTDLYSPCAISHQVSSVIAACDLDRAEQRAQGAGGGVTATVLGAADTPPAAQAGQQDAAGAAGAPAPAASSSPTVTVSLQSSSSEALAGAKRVLEDLLTGGLLLFTEEALRRVPPEAAALAAQTAAERGAPPPRAGEPAWADELLLPEGSRFLRELGVRTGAFVLRDARRQELRLFGKVRAPRALVLHRRSSHLFCCL